MSQKVEPFTDQALPEEEDFMEAMAYMLLGEIMDLLPRPPSFPVHVWADVGEVVQAYLDDGHEPEDVLCLIIEDDQITVDLSDSFKKFINQYEKSN